MISLTRYTSIQFRCSSLICFFAQHYWSLGFQDLYFLNFFTWTCLFSQLLPFLSLNLCGIWFRIGSRVKISQYIKPNDIFGALVETCIAVPLGIAVSHNPMTPLIKLQRHILFPWFHLSSMFSLAPSIFSSDLRNIVLWFSGTWLFRVLFLSLKCH